jgi:hypothetical protein
MVKIGNGVIKNGIFFLASIRVTASLSTAYLNSGFSVKIAWTMVFASEQEIPRPNNKRRRKSYYSGKKKKHTIKTQYIVNSEGTILHKTGHDRGRKHDYDVYKNNHPITPVQVENVFDLGYFGVQNDFPTVKSVLPVRKKKNVVLSGEERTYKRKHSQLRMIVEHTICRIKKFGIMSGKFRNRLRKYDDMSDIVSALLNFRIMIHTNRMSF